MMYDILIKNANVYKKERELKKNIDIAIKDGLIVAQGKNIPEEGTELVIDATGKLVSPAFVDTHMHIDLSYTYDYELEVPSLIGGSKLFKPEFDRYHYMTDQQIYDEIYARSARTLDACIKNGTSLVKTNVTYIDSWKGISLDVMDQLKRDYKGYCDLKTCVTFTNPVPDENFEKIVVPEWEEAARNGKVDFVSGYPHKHPDYKPIIDSIFERAEKFGLPIDIHCDESDVPNLDCFSYMINKTMKENYNGRVTLGHVTALSARLMDKETAKRLIQRAAEADVNITTLTSCNMYLMNYNRRGPVQVKELLEAGVNVAVASDDIREVLRPTGNCDLLEEALLTAQVHKLGTKEQLRKVFDMITYNAAKNAEKKLYGTEIGDQADLVILDAESPENALINQAEKLYFIKDGRVVCTND